ncbi:Predicted transcriptional regulator YdeE, contains AraC-type DNA-binding domain [Eubacterium barkeri]|uniref:Predicted transcriptional regulator YdeE, contains AraC-type DNA-binding domain n=1 Tax=Eubacterium barkeri TaxID=1528 RepID=A0A1H3BSC8_EUBBA|nr:Predicted transcriptional regulator YdeE, contains AraC-type DNA-binding domain [Eubacterium barkeri]
MEYRIEKHGEIRIVGVSAPLQHKIEKNFEIVPQMWQKAVMDGTIPQLSTMMNSVPMGLLGVSVCNDESNWKYYIAVASDQPINGTKSDANTIALEEYIIPAATWAIFSGSGVSQSMQELEKRIVTEWLPTSGYEYANAPDIEVYLSADPQNAKYEVWIPVIKK